MNLQRFIKYLPAFLLLGFCGSGQATPYPIPSPLPPGLPPGISLGADIDGNGLFSLGSPALALEVYDLLDPVGTPDFEFGFYYGGNSSVLTPIFQVNDSAIFGPQSARVSFTGPIGQVFDIDQNVIQGTFDNILGTAPIGFYLRLFSAGSLNGTTIFTQAILNDFGQDLAAAYPVIGAPSTLQNPYLIGFRDPTTTDLVPIYASVVASSPSPSAVPVPGAILLWLTGLAGLATFRRFLTSSSPALAGAAR